MVTRGDLLNDRFDRFVGSDVAIAVARNLEHAGAPGEGVAHVGAPAAS